MRHLVLGLLRAAVVSAAIGCPAALAEEAPVANCSRTEAGGERTLCHEAVMPLPVAEVWALWTTSAGLSSWAAPVAAIDARPGGVFETSYNPNARIGDAANIRNRVVALIPERMLVIQVASAPPGFPHAAEVRELATVVELEPVGARATRVRVSMLGYRGGEAFDALYRHFDWGNAYTLDKLRERATTGPVDWRAAPAQRQGQ
jgi:uncharacterized protein YndB with AHSA1/START domain